MAEHSIDATETPTERHRLYEDALAILTGTLIMSLGIIIYSKAMLLTGSTSGLALLLQYATGAEFWLVFSLVNLPSTSWRSNGSAGCLRCAPSSPSASSRCFLG